MARPITPEAVAAQNTINALANEIEGHLIRLLSGWQGRKAWKVSGYGGMVAALRGEFDRYCEAHGYNRHDAEPVCPVWLNLYSQHGCLVLHLRHLPSALKVECYLGRVDDAGVLTRLEGCKHRRTDFTPEEVRAAFERAYQLESQARELRSAFREFA